jgi:hypothetical protein
MWACSARSRSFGRRDDQATQRTRFLLRPSADRLRFSGNYSGSIDPREMDVCNLGFPDSSFDAVATAFTFCSVRKPVAGLSELTPRTATELPVAL